MATTKTTNERLFKAADLAVNALFVDQTVSESKCRENLETLRAEIDAMLNSLQSDDSVNDAEKT